MNDDRARLRPLRILPADFALRIPISVGPTADVVLDTNLYTMPPDAAGLPGTLFLYRDRLRIVAGRFEAEHERKFGKHQRSILPEHRATHLAAVSGQRGKRYLKRQHLFECGIAAVEFLSEIVHRRPRLWSDDVDRLHDLLQTFGPEALELAFRTALDNGTCGAEYVAHYLQQPFLELEMPDNITTDVPYEEIAQ
jgi:hypothetical protein